MNWSGAFTTASLMIMLLAIMLSVSDYCNGRDSLKGKRNRFRMYVISVIFMFIGVLLS